MTTDAAAATSTPAAQPADLPLDVRARILLYLAVLVLMLGLGAPYGGLINLPITFFLKNKLHMSADQVALFGLVSGAPLYISFLAGFARDIWNPIGLRDRGFMVVFGVITAAIFASFAFVPVSAASLLLAVMVMTASYLFVAAAQNGLSSAIGRQHVMSGQISAVWNIVASLPTMGAFVVGGFLSQMLEGRNAEQAARTLFMIGAVIMAGVALYALWRPSFVYDQVRSEQAAEFHPWRDLKRLLGHWPAYPALLIWTLWNFAPGSVTPLQYYLQNTLHASDADWGLWNFCFTVGFIPTFLLYGALCRKVALNRLLFWGAVVAVPQMVPLAFIHSVPIALAGGALAGLLGGVCSAAYIDLLIRCCPKGLEGTILMASVASYWVITRLGDVLGAYLYDHFGGFDVCVIAITAVYALIVPTLWLVPKRLTATPDGVAPVGGFDAETDRPEIAL